MSSSIDASDAVKHIHEACRDVGFFYITGHGVLQHTTDTVMEAARLFFEMPFEKKIALSIRNSKAYRGYIQKGSEMTADKVDVKEGIYFGPDVTSDDPDVICGTPMVGSNQYPDEGDLPNFPNTVKQYREQMKTVGLSLMRAMAMGLQLPKCYFDDMFSNPILQDDVGGLEVQTKDGKWIDVPPIPGTFVVNVGDPLEAWTKGLYRATLHRVRSFPGKDRYSAPFFYGPNPRCIIEPLDTDLTRDLSYTPEFLLKMPFRFGDYYYAKFQQSFDWFSE
ncbi:hypothetical protein OS493_009311 [Desmophyllum pertusum]|uniref:Fe2OG dioxygenase domain-containing protein n=1 Tax=Desmophyllum pertusum TaxID=174260 RepID=A0A9W9Z267_9CNID|nr:hypothetical protein OS493_009311 [Desmophyllum pertusum]